ncbi:MAG TPA: FAD-dependent oxidoreductase [Candidatus Atribacteria bacterium]|nr:FAD-dependent oxidoreductase [Candidatus Atribacteria bacterium]
MRTAIIGAGLSGLSCAIYLEKHGLRPVIFERRRLPGDRFVNGEAIFHALNRPYNDCLPYFEKEFGIALKPISVIETMTFYSENKRSDIKGNLGYTNIRGRHPDSFESQLAAQVRSDIIYNSDKTYDDLLKEFDRVVLATGDAEDACRLGNFRADLTVSLRGATVEGSFVPSNPIAWLNNSFAPQGIMYN